MIRWLVLTDGARSPSGAVIARPNSRTDLITASSAEMPRRSCSSAGVHRHTLAHGGIVTQLLARPSGPGQLGHDGQMAECNEHAEDPEPSADTEAAPTGLYGGFEAYRTPTNSDYRALLMNGLVVPDTNVFLNLYRYNEPTRNDLFAVMRSLGARLWVPHWVMVEFWRNREAVLQDPRNTVGTVSELSAHCGKALDTIRGWANRIGLDQPRIAELVDTLAHAFDTVAKGVTQFADQEAPEFARDTNKDPVLIALESILRDRVGAPLDKDDYKKAVADAKLRADAQIPPGYKDIRKGAETSAGDYLVWLQILLEARSKHRDVLLVTGDVKEDWWRRERGEIRGPHPDLVEEMRRFANVQLFMLRPESLLLQARQVLQIRVRDESVQDVERVDRVWKERNTLFAIKLAEDKILGDAINQQWKDILNDVRVHRRVAWLLLNNCSATRMDGNTIIVEFPNVKEAKGFMMGDYASTLADVLKERFGIEFEIETTATAHG